MLATLREALMPHLKWRQAQLLKTLHERKQSKEAPATRLSSRHQRHGTERAEDCSETPLTPRSLRDRSVTRLPPPNLFMITATTSDNSEI